MPSTNDVLKRTRSSNTVSVLVRKDMKQDELLANPANKHRLINQLSSTFESHAYNVHNADADADLLMVQTAAESAGTKDNILVGDDTDLLDLL